MSVNVSSNLQIATTVLTTLIPTWNVLSGFYIPRPVSNVQCLVLLQLSWHGSVKAYPDALTADLSCLALWPLLSA